MGRFIWELAFMSPWCIFACLENTSAPKSISQNEYQLESTLYNENFLVESLFFTKTLIYSFLNRPWRKLITIIWSNPFPLNWFFVLSNIENASFFCLLFLLFFSLFPRPYCINNPTSLFYNSILCAPTDANKSNISLDNFSYSGKEHLKTSTFYFFFYGFICYTGQLWQSIFLHLL